MAYSYDRATSCTNTFSRTAANVGSMGGGMHSGGDRGYFTHLGCARVIGERLHLPEDEEVCVLEPSIGDGSSVVAVTGADTNHNVKIFGVELNHDVCEVAKNNSDLESVIEADFTCGVKISNNRFSLCFSNPPYLDDDSDGSRVRMETVFLEKITGAYLAKGGILVYVIPHSRFMENLRYIAGHYDILDVYRFWPEEYQKWHQVVFIGRKSGYARIPLKDEMQALRERFEDAEKVPVLPQTFVGTEKYRDVEVMPSKAEELTLFAPKELDPVAALKFLSDGPDMDDFLKMRDKAVTQVEFTSSDLGQPPIRPKKDLVYLMQTAGVGQGLAGEPGIDAHLQRGVAEVVEESEYAEDEKGHVDSVKVLTRTKVTMSIIETNGTITVLE